MDYEKGYVYDLMDQGGPTDNREPYFKEAVEEMMRARTLCAKANATLPDDPGYVSYLEELFGRKLDDVRIRSSSGWGMVSSVLAVQMNSTSDRSKGTFR